MFGEFKPSKFDVPIPHRNWKRVLSEAFCYLSCASPGEVVCITGPSRAGKSLLIRRLIQMLVGDNCFDQTGRLPAVVVEAVNTGPHGSFSTKAFTQRMLDAVKHPVFTIRGQSLDDMLAIQKMDRTTEPSLRLFLEYALVARGVKFLFIDEAQHVKYVSKNAQAPSAVMNSWKCLAQTAGLVIVFVGAYPILDILVNATHLLGRKNPVHFQRYHPVEEDIESFAELLQSYSVLIDLDSSLNSLVDVTELMYEGSLGCIGLLKAWLKCTDAISTIQQKKIDVDLLRHTRLTDLDLRAIKAEILAGEDNMKKSYMSEVRDTGCEATPSDPTKKTSKPFQRKPTREVARNRVEIDK